MVAFCCYKKWILIVVVQLCFAISVSGDQPGLNEIDEAKIGNKRSDPTVLYHVSVKTADGSWTGTDADVYIQIFGKLGNTSVVQLTKPGNLFESGKVDNFIMVDKAVGSLTKVGIKRNQEGLFDDWKLEKTITSAMKLVVLVVAVFCFPAAKGGNDPCSSYKELSQADRERKYSQDTLKSDANDLESGAWYRFTGKAGFKLSNRLKRNVCLSGIQCGTSSPGFMIGHTLKKEGKTRKRKVCFSHGNKCCAREVSIRVKRCPGGFLVYQLPAAPPGNTRYCGQAKKQKPTKPPTTNSPAKTGEDQSHPGKSCKVIKDENSQGGSGLYWINPDGGEAFQAYCDQETDGGGWTLVYSYHFTNYPNFMSGTNAVTPRPSWKASGDIPESTTTPLSETQFGAIDFNMWKQIGHEFMAKSNINNWIVCNEGNGSLVEYRAGSLNCRVVKNVASVCHNVVPDEIRFLTKEASTSFGPHLYNSKSQTWLKTYYYWESSTQSPNWPTHDPCGQNGLSHVKNVPNPYGNIYIR